MLKLSYWIDLTGTYQIKIATVLYCFQWNVKRANYPKREGERIKVRGLVMKREGIRTLNIYGTPQNAL